MKNETKTSTTSNPKQKEKVGDVDNFKKDIVLERSKTKERRLLGSLIFLVFTVFAGLGIGYYQIFVKPEQLENTVPAEQKIESKPEVKIEEKQPEQQAQTTPAETPAPTPKPAVTEYTVQSGDTWSSVANENGMSSKQLMDYNGATSEDLQIGQKIKIPNS